MPAPSTERNFADAMVNVRREHGFEPLEVEGEVPDGLRGTYVRNGPGLLSMGDHRYRGWFDGDGALSAVRFTDAGALGGVRVLETPGLLEERRRGRRYFGSYATRSPGWWNPLRAMRLATGTTKNPANTNVIYWQERLLALCEVGRPFEARLEDLGSVGETDLGCVSRGFSAHPHRVAATGAMYNIGLTLGPRPVLDVFALPPVGAASQLASFPLSHSTMIHDFAVTERHLVIFVAPLHLVLWKTIFNLSPFVDNLRWTPADGTEVFVVPIEAPDRARRFKVEPFWFWHVANAFDRGDEIVVDLIGYDDFASSAVRLADISEGHVPVRGREGRLERVTIDPGREAMTRTRLREIGAELPRVSPGVDARPHRFVYSVEHSSPEHTRDGLGDSLTCFDVETGDADTFTFGGGRAPSEGVFAPRPGGDGERDGWLLTQVYDPAAHETYWAVLDAAHLADGPRCEIRMGHHVPHTFHGRWIPSAG